MASREPIAVIGTGYVGLVTAAGFAELGHDVWCVDVDVEKVARLTRGEVPIYEPGLSESVAAHSERLHFSAELAPALEHARLLFVAVGTPPTYSGDADLSAVYSVVDAMPVSGRHALVMKSTVPVGTGAAIKRRLAEQNKGFSYVSCPEFLKEGSALADFRAPDRVVVGDDGDWAGDAVVALYAPLGAALVRTDIASAEMVKLASNAFLATKISFINEIANVCEETGADVGEVARGMGLDSRIGPHFLRPGVGFGGSCLPGEETVLVRHHGRTTLQRFDRLYERLLAFGDEETEEGLIEPHRLEVLTWAPLTEEPFFLPVQAVTKRRYEGELVDIRTKMGRRLSTTHDHPWIVGDGRSDDERIVLADELSTDDWVPLTRGRAPERDRTCVGSLLAAVEAAELSPSQLVVRPRREALEALVSLPIADRREIFRRAPSAFPRAELAIDEAFWRVVGLYLAEGHTTFETSGRARIGWSFHPSREEHLVDEVVAYWLRHAAGARVYSTPTARRVDVSSRLLAAWWTGVLGMGRTSYAQRLPDLIWDQPDAAKWALLSGLFEGDGSWSLINGGPSVIIELGTVSDELADGVLRLLGDVGIVASRRVGRAPKSTKDTHWIRVSGAAQVERAIELIPQRDRAGALASITRQARRIAPTGYRRFDAGTPWVRIASIRRRPFAGDVYSMEVIGTHAMVSTSGIAIHNCFPKDVSALKQLAGNSGYHFQLLTAVIEVNELQKRRVIGKLQKHLGTLVGKRVALLGLAFKPHTDDMRDASSLVLAARLHADGARVAVYDPVAETEARKLITSVDFAASALDAVAGADAVVLVTEWPEFAEIDWVLAAERMEGTTVIDGRNFLDGAVVRGAGLVYEGIGRA